MTAKCGNALRLRFRDQMAMQEAVLRLSRKVSSGSAFVLEELCADTFCLP